MAEWRGQPLLWMGLIMACWVSARLAMTTPTAPQRFALGTAPQPMIERAQVTPKAAAPLTFFPNTGGRSVKRSRRLLHSYGLTPALDPWQDGGRPSGLLAPLRVAEESKPLSTGRDTPPTNALAPQGKAGTPTIERRWGAELYAYSFWRFATGSSAALAPGAQYGGSQSGVIATVDPFGRPDRGLAFLARGSVSPDGDERELALGLRWKPDADWPFLLSAERRLRADAPDRFAAYLSGGVNALSLVGKWNLDAYGQVGYASGKGGGEFFDAQARIAHPLTELAGIPLSLGVGSWAGGQRGTKRIDFGPTAIARLDTGPAVVLVQLDWRLRAAGNAEPEDAIALTVSTGF